MKTKLWIGFGLLSLVAAACAPLSRSPASAGVTPVPGPIQTWIDAPLPDSTLPLQPYRLVFHGASPVSVTGFEVRVNGAVVASAPATASRSAAAQIGTLFLGEYDWTPPAPGTYLIAVRAEADGQFSPADQVRVTVAGDETETPTPEAPTPTRAPSLPPTVEEVEECTYTPSVHLNCRQGPGTAYPVLEVLAPDQPVPVVGWTEDGLYWYLLGPASGQECTVPSVADYGEASGDCSDAPILTPVPRPTATPTQTPSPTPTVELVEGCTYRPSVNVECREGPAMDYPVLEILPAGQTVPIVGRTADELYWFVLGPASGQECAVPTDVAFGEALGDCGDAPIVTPN